METREERRITRRDFLWYSLSTGVVVCAGTALPGDADAREFEVVRGRTPERVFPQSVASGDPRQRGIVLWTRLAPEVARRVSRNKQKRRGGRVRVAYEISRTPSFRRPVLRGTAITAPGRDFTVKIQLARRELQPGETYFYRFILNGTASKVGRFKTLPATDAELDSLRLGYTSCQDFTNGYYNALRYLAEEDIDYVVHLGDYIYETVSEESFQGGGPPERAISLPSGRDRAETLADYRFLYRTYKSDPDLQRLHERFAMINIWDDHEFANDCYRTFDSDTEDESQNNAPGRREAANRAWTQYIPAGVPYDPKRGPLEEIKIYRSFNFGDLATLVMTDERLYRDGPPCGLGTSDKYGTTGCEIEGAKRGQENPGRTMLGGTQKEWFLDGITGSQRLWKIWGNETMFMQLKLLNTELTPLLENSGEIPILGGAALEPGDLPEDGSVYVNLDQWDGYIAERREISEAVKAAGVDNFVVITGDLHTYLAGYVKLDYEEADNTDESNLAGVCFMAGSVTSSNLEELAARNSTGNPADLSPAITASNPHIEFFNSSTHGYNIIEMNRDELRCVMKAVSTVREPKATLSTIATFRVPVNEIELIEEEPIEEL